MASVLIQNHRGRTGWLVAGMLLICGGCSLEMSSPRPEFWRINHLPPKTGSARFIFIDTAASSHISSSNKAKGEKGLELTEPSPVSDKEQQPLASPKPISPTPEIPEKEKDSAVPVIKVPEKEKQPPAPDPGVAEKEKQPAVPVPKVPEKEKDSAVPVIKVPEKEKQPPAPVPGVAEKEKQPAVPMPKVPEKGESPVPVPEAPEKEKKPPILVPDVPEKVNGQAVVTYKTKIEETRDLIRVIDESRLTKEQHDTFNSIHSFLEKAQEAFSQDDMSMAVNLAEKANTLAKEIVRNSP